MNKQKVMRFLRDALIAFVFWTATLSLYMIFVVHVTLSQYVAWVLMQLILVPPLGAVSAIIFRWFDKQGKKK